MADDKTKQDGRDDARIDSSDSNEVQYAATQFGVSPEKIREAIKQVGNLRKDVEAYLKS